MVRGLRVRRMMNRISRFVQVLHKACGLGLAIITPMHNNNHLISMLIFLCCVAVQIVKVGRAARAQFKTMVSGFGRLFGVGKVFSSVVLSLRVEFRTLPSLYGVYLLFGKYGVIHIL